MSDEEKPSKKAKKVVENKEPKAKKLEYKYGTKYIAEKRGIKDQTVRLGLRKHEIPKVSGNQYGWNSKAEVDEIIAKVWPKESVSKAA